MAGGTLGAWVQAGKGCLSSWPPSCPFSSAGRWPSGQRAPSSPGTPHCPSRLAHRHLATNLANDATSTTSWGPMPGSRSEAPVSFRRSRSTPAGDAEGNRPLRHRLLYCLHHRPFTSELHLLAIPILFSAFSSYFYVAPPIRYGYHGLGELFVGINMGPVMVAGTYWVVAGAPASNLSFPYPSGSWWPPSSITRASRT